jgi:hypothetical protein
VVALKRWERQLPSVFEAGSKEKCVGATGRDEQKYETCRRLERSKFKEV